MDKYYKINEVAQLLRVPAATIRYWESENLIRVFRDEENDYRLFSLSSVIELSNISFFRSLDIPIKELRLFLESDSLNQEEVLQSAERRLAEEMKLLKAKQKRIEIQRFLLQEIRRLRNQKPYLSTPEFQYIISFDAQNQLHWQHMINSPHSFALLLDIHDRSFVRYGIGLPEGYSGKLNKDANFIWSRNNDTAYMEALLRSNSYRESENNLSEHLTSICSSHTISGMAAAQFLTTTQEGGIYDYYKVWIEVNSTNSFPPPV